MAKERLRHIDWNWETEYGEDQSWVELSNGRSIEITRESYGVAVPYFSVRLHCTDEEFDKNMFHSTCGVIDQGAFDTEAGVLNMANAWIADQQCQVV